MINLRENVEAMFEQLIVYVPDENGTRFFRPESAEAVVARVRAWRQRNPARAKAYDAARYAANRESRRAHARAYYATRRGLA